MICLIEDRSATKFSAAKGSNFVTLFKLWDRLSTYYPFTLCFLLTFNV